MDTLAKRMEWALAQVPGGNQAGLAKAAGVKGPSVTSWFNGRTRQLKAESLRKAASYLGVDRDWLNTGRGSPTPTTARLVVAEPTAGYLTPDRVLEQMGALLAQVPTDLRQAVADNLAGWALEGGAEHRREVLSMLLRRGNGKLRRSG